MKISDNDVLIPKFGKEEKFYNTLSEMNKIGHGKLGWKGQAELILDLGIIDSLGIKIKGSKEEKIKQIVEYLQQTFLQDLYEYGEWVSPEIAKKRKISRKVLYGK